MSIKPVFAGMYNAIEFAYGVNPDVPALSVIGVPPAATGSATLSLQSGYIQVNGINGSISVLNTNAPVTVGADNGVDTSITLTAVNVGIVNQPGSASITGSWSFLHGTGDPVASATVGLQEAINYAFAQGGGEVIVDAAWYRFGGSATILAAASLPWSVTSTTGYPTVKISDTSQSPVSTWGLRYNTTTLLAAPTIPLSTQVASLTGVTGTFTAATYYINFIYVDAQGGITLASAQYSFTATANLAVGGSGPIAETGAVGYLVMTGAATTNYINNPLATTSSGTIIYPGGIPCFKIGTSFTVTAPATSALPIAPVEATAYARGTAPYASPAMVQAFPTVFPPFAATGVVTFGTAVEAARIDFPAGFFNSLGRTVQLKIWFNYTPVSTATLIPSLVIYGGVYGVSGVTLWTVTTAATSGTTTSDGWIEITLVTSATGSSGTFEAHGLMVYAGATGSAPTYVAAGDANHAASSAVDLTKQDTLSFTINSGTANLTTFQVRSMQLITLA